MTRQEFIKLVKADERVQFLQTTAFGVVVVSFGSVLCLLVSRWQDKIGNRSAPHLGILAGVTAGWCVAAILAVRLGSQKLLKCPYCQKPLGGSPSQVVVASSHCGHCGQRIIDEG